MLGRGDKVYEGICVTLVGVLGRGGGKRGVWTWSGRNSIEIEMQELYSRLVRAALSLFNKSHSKAPSLPASSVPSLFIC